ncbi:hypothetical protein M0812_04415 [Anaeramoeba flamelloides]|uniref:Uncharacterized protein n=1 Tax=Anaeramoeba flamelloides TaxID=1746091 RepID=A0AAV8AEC0_9EUKA|nr:hypothetical protein M0812_04415 [Anaeramoeba flamelloides]
MICKDLSQIKLQNFIVNKCKNKRKRQVKALMETKVPNKLSNPNEQVQYECRTNRTSKQNKYGTAEEQKSRIAEEQKSRRAEEQKSRRAEEQKSRRAEEQKSRRAEEQKSRTSSSTSAERVEEHKKYKNGRHDFDQEKRVNK